MAYFPGGVLTYTRFSDLLPSEAADAARWHALKMKADKTPAEISEFNTLTTRLATKLFTAATFNSLFDEIIALENFFNDEVQGYIQDKQAEFDAKVDAFKVIGEWSGLVTYEFLNIVTKYGASFVAKRENTNVAPVENQTTDDWGLLAKKGEQGPQGASGTGLSPRGLWDATVQYFTDDCVARNNILWQALEDNIDSEPTSQNTKWMAIMNLTEAVATHNTDANAHANLMATVLTTTLTVVGWGGSVAPYTQTLNVRGLEVDGYSYFVAPDISAWSAYVEAGIKPTADITSENLITFTATAAKPTVAIPLLIYKSRTGAV